MVETDQGRRLRFFSDGKVQRVSANVSNPSLGNATPHMADEHGQHVVAVACYKRRLMATSLPSRSSTLGRRASLSRSGWRDRGPWDCFVVVQHERGRSGQPIWRYRYCVERPTSTPATLPISVSWCQNFGERWQSFYALTSHAVVAERWASLENQVGIDRCRRRRVQRYFSLPVAQLLSAKLAD
jgi:hypothetical protein